MAHAESEESAENDEKGRLRTVDRSQAVAAEGEGVCHHAKAVLADIESKFARVRPGSLCIRDHHLGEGGAVHDGAVALLVLVEVLDLVEYDTLAILGVQVGESAGAR